MPKGNGKNKTDVLGNPNYKRYDLSDPANWEGDYPDGDWGNNIEKILATKSKEEADDRRFVFIRGNFKNDRILNACLRLSYRHGKFGDIDHQELLYCKILGSAAINGVSRLEALFAGTNLLASDMYRAARGMPKLKKGEEERVIRGSDFRKEERPPDGGLGAASK